MRENRLYGSEGGGTGRSPYPYRRGQSLVFCAFECDNLRQVSKGALLIGN
jgi:hypothetical protein